MTGTAFAGIAEEYHQYRVPYPDEVFDWIRREYGLDGRGRLLDAGCGTGYVCLPLSRWFEDVVAIDPEPDMLRVAERAARRQGVANVRFLRLRAEEVTPSLAPLRLVTFGNSFHWTDRVNVAHTLFPLIAPGGGLVAVASSSVGTGEEPWKAALLDTIDAWMGPGAGQRVSAGRLPGAPHHSCAACSVIARRSSSVTSARGSCVWPRTTGSWMTSRSRSYRPSGRARERAGLRLGPRERGGYHGRA